MNPQLHITFLGTGTSQGIPIIGSTHPVCLSTNLKDKRLRSSVLVSWEDVNYVIDCGPDFRQQMLRENVQAINGVLFTHEHADHTAGLDDIRPFYFQQGKIPFYLSKRVYNNLKQRFEYIFETENRYPGAPEVAIHVIDKKSFILDNVTVTPIEFLHGQLPIFGYRFNDVAYLTDLKTIDEFEKEKLKGLEVLVINALRIEEHNTHLNLQEALQLIEELQPKRTYLTHISHKLGFHEEVEKLLPDNVFLAFDGLKVTI